MESETIRRRGPRRAGLRGGFRLGRIFGIEIHLDPSWLLIFLLVTWSLAAGLLPRLHRDWSPALSVLLAVTASLLFFASVLVHELSHSLVAKSKGLPVRRITLFLFGGVSNIEREPPSPGTEFWMAVVGPVASLLLGVLFLTFGGAHAGFGTAMGDPERAFAGLSPVSTLLLWLGSVNVLLGFFNLVPGFPLDGGRILRSILWAATRNLRKATRLASWVGQGIGWLFIVAGITMAFGFSVPFFGRGLFNGIWLAFIGWFLNNAAAASYTQVVVEDLLEDVPVSRLMRSEVPTVTAELSVRNLVDEWLLGTDERAFPVLKGDRLAGLVCLEDVRKVPREAWEKTTVREIMTPAEKLSVVGPREELAEAFRELTSRDVRQIPVVENGRLVGLLRRRDIVRWLQLHSELEAA